jgi:hypothetical protein
MSPRQMTMNSMSTRMKMKVVVSTNHSLTCRYTSSVCTFTAIPMTTIPRATGFRRRNVSPARCGAAAAVVDDGDGAAGDEGFKDADVFLRSDDIVAAR